MRRADRLFQIVQFLRGGRLVTAAQLAAKLEVSERTIYRDIADLIGSGVPVEGEAGVGYVMRGGYDLPPLMFSQDEIVALVAGARLIRAWGGLSMAAAAEEALVKINSVLPAPARDRSERVQIHAFPFSQMSDVVRDRLDRIEAAIHARARLIVHYAKESGVAEDRCLRPLGLYFWGKVWTLVAWCELREDFRSFRVDRMTRMEVGDPFREERDKSLKAYYDTQRLHGDHPPH
ncbi:transcriptional regulator(repressor protein) [Pseudooceanicola batsensis HTCC2597]|uniref:Transcriptional regulator(Repressor protein) n=1 Tax=Pseudooceanicola batsensis (strain ATCC BAA-863 / DSM 15984 / KCTC 12145 / HTCC2597) TaxID=252305 RepID=A3TW25_PSEBH|nr:YafY family protein [Pseudooceanicola batsensis]EAQ03821.1 transcriptional regulator(repressor protein) [Pseudooceanicola batsensis HTCC2597]